MFGSVSSKNQVKNSTNVVLSVVKKGIIVPKIEHRDVFERITTQLLCYNDFDQGTIMMVASNAVTTTVVD